MNKYDVIIIGAGIGGLTCGCYLAKFGLRVLIVEQHNIVGGYCGSFFRKGYRFDSSVHYIGGLNRKFLSNIFEELEIFRRIKFKRLSPTDKIIVRDKITYIHADVKNTINEFLRNFPNEHNALIRFFKFIMEEDIFHIYQKVKNLNFQSVLDNYFKDEKLKVTLETILCNFGLSASQISSLTAIFLYRDYILDGGYYPVGGMQAFSDAFADVFRSYGGEILLRNKVSKIIVNNNCVDGVILENGNQLLSQYVVSNSDATKTFFELLPYNQIEKQKINALSVSPSLFVLYLGMKKTQFYKTGETCNIWVSDTYKLSKYLTNLESYIRKGDFPFYMINFPSEHDDSVLKKTMQVFTIAPWVSEEFWISNKKYLESMLIEKVKSFIGFSQDDICVQESATPKTFYRYTLNTCGAAFGWASLTSQINSTILPVMTSLKGLFLTGHWCTIGSGQGGVPKTIVSGKKTSDVILKKIGKKVFCG